jgi:tetratricopeptide (TPR) repeat protein
MKAESIVFAVAGMCFGVILGWVIAAQQGGGGSRAAAPPAASATEARPGTGNAQQAPVLDEGRVQALTTILQNDPKNSNAALQLGSAYFEARRYDDAIEWYVQALTIDPKNTDASAELGLTYYFVGQTDRALRQFETSLEIDPRHAKTLLNKGMVLAFGRQDLSGAAALWKNVIEIAPDSREAQAARRGLEGIASAGHPGGSPTPGS